MDPYRCLRLVFDKNYLGVRYRGKETLFKYLSERGVKGKLRYNYLPSFVMMEHWVKGFVSRFDLYFE